MNTFHTYSIAILAVLTSVSYVLSEDDLLDQYVTYVENNAHFPRARRHSVLNNNDGPSSSAGVINNIRHKRDVDTADQNSDFHTNSVSNVRKTRDVLSDVKWTHEEVLDGDGNVIVKWYVKDKKIFFRMEAKTRGYIGLGFSPNGDMRGADIVIIWVDDDSGVSVIWDCHGSDEKNAAPIRDEIENYQLEMGIQNDTHTIAEFNRMLDTCDSNDYTLAVDTVRLIWAIHDSDPQLGVPLAYHGMNRGTRSVHLMSPPPVHPPKPHDPNIRKWEVTLLNFVVPDNMDTLYWCKIFKPPTLRTKHHIIGYEPVLAANHSGHAHHMLLYECEIGDNFNKTEWEAFAKGSGSACYGVFMPRSWEVCLTPVVAWAIGSKGEFLPNHVGFPLADKPNSYYMLEVHFDNPSLRRSVGTSGLNIHYTRHLRKHDSGVMVAGVTVSPIHVIPPKQPEYKTAGLCSSECTKVMFPERGINVVSVLLHSHLAGKRLSLRHIRNGEELPRIAEDNHYDFDYQQSRMLKKERVIFPGDTLITECVYQTKKRNKPTVGGYSTKQEMCLAFVMYYPRTQLAGCYSMAPVKQFFDNFNVKEFYGNDMRQLEDRFLSSGSESTIITPKPTQLPPTAFPSFAPGAEMSYEANQQAIKALQAAKEYTIEGDSGALDGPFDQLVIKEPQEFQNKTFMAHLNELAWEEPVLVKSIEESFYKGQHLTFCRKRDDTQALPMKVLNFPNFMKYIENTTGRQCNLDIYLNAGSSFNNLFSPTSYTIFVLLILFQLIY